MSAIKRRRPDYPPWAMFIICLPLLVGGCKADRPGGKVENISSEPTVADMQPSAEGGASTLSHDAKSTNRLINEKSPYLLQHAHNPVDWYPWGEEAFAAAIERDKPIFLSIGYSTCHWCHVLEEESFSDPEVAEALNKTFIAIKVDREERPDIDNVYMQVCQLMSQSCGWPLNIIMTPSKKPFLAMTYIPKESRFGRMGIIELANKIKELWGNRRDDLLKNADRAMEAVRQSYKYAPGSDLGEGILKSAYSQLSASFDDKYGGFGSAPKFPAPHKLLFLLRYYNRTGEKRALEMVEKTLAAMRLGGIYDHVGFGFHRYSTDAQWLVPHFEKMLYDQALLAMAYTEAYQLTGKKEYRETAEEIFTYALRDMKAPEGGFYSAEDADSEGREGKFYLWTEKQVVAVLGEEDAAWLVKKYNSGPGGNFSGSEVPNANILHLKKPLNGAAERRARGAMLKLFNAREKRPHPFKDDKVLTDWNGLMIAALAKAAGAFNEPKYADAARRAADFLLEKMRDNKGNLLHRYRQGEAAVPAYLDDYAFLAMGLIDLYEATFEVKYLKAAFELNDHMLEHFRDDESGGLFFTSDEAETTLTRAKDIYDGALPSGNSVAALNLMRLGRISANSDYEEEAAQIGRAFSRIIEQSPTGFAQMLLAVDFWVGPSYEVVISGDPESESALKMITALRGKYVPNKALIFRPAGDAAEIAELAKYVENQAPVKNRATAYVCQNYKCRRPTNSVREMLSAFNPSP